MTKEGKWYVVDRDRKEVQGTRGHSKQAATDLLAEIMNMLHGGNNSWVYWQKQGFKVRRS